VANAGTISTRPVAIPERDGRGRVVKATALADGRELSVTAALTYPVRDAAGDFVHPGGLEFATHARDPWVDLEHGCHPDCGAVPVGRCEHPVTKAYGVSFESVELDGKVWALPFATTYFDPADKLQSQVFALCERGALPGVSLEFRPIPGLFKSYGHRALVPRPYPADACEFFRADVVRYTHCAIPVCEGAQVLDGGVVRKAAPALLSMLSARRVGGEAMHPAILKALGHYLPGKSNTVRVEKAMDDYDAAPVAAPVADAPEPEPEAPAMGGIAALYAKAQALLDACSQNESDMETSDSPELRAKAAKWRDKIGAIAEEIKGVADAHDAKLNGGKQDDGDPDDDGDADVDMGTDEDGMLKAIRAPYKPILKAVRVRRIALSEIRKADPEPEPAPEPADGDGPEDVAYLERQLRLFNRDLRIYG